MKQSYMLMAIATGLSFGIASAAAHAHPGFTAGAMGPQMHMKGGMGPGAMQGSAAGFAGAQQLVTPEERAAFIEKMRNAKTPEERQQIATANHAEMQKRAKEKGITLHQLGPHGTGAGFGPHFSPPVEAPAR